MLKDDDYEYRKGCGYLGSFFLYRENEFAFCCVAKTVALNSANQTITDAIQQWGLHTNSLIDDIKNQRNCVCTDCHMLSDGYWVKSADLYCISIDSDNKDDICNFGCVYCFAKNKLNNFNVNENKKTALSLLLEISKISYLKQKNLFIQLSNGEPCANKDADSIFDIFNKTNWSLVLNTNFSIYNKNLAKLIENGKVGKIITSLDAGTRKTFKKIKNADKFNDVLNNIEKYPIHKTNLVLHYLFIEDINDNMKDIKGFYSIAKKIKSRINFTSDLYRPYTDRMRVLVLWVIKKAISNDIIVGCTEYVNRQDQQFINYTYKKLKAEFDEKNKAKLKGANKK
ncbi:MAG: radical SAM protein [Firmicutes bacterium]|nr:radical SAM protein [Bacillota bacterium]